jgi:hypothetical protein
VGHTAYFLDLKFSNFLQCATQQASYYYRHRRQGVCASIYFHQLLALFLIAIANKY